MRTTLTLDDDVAAKLKAEARRLGLSFRETVNAALRRGLATQRSVSRKPFRVMSRDLGNPQPGLTLDSIADLIEQVEGPLHR
ncbi:MAG: ribbon-helix-helix domain-containing protein [Nitrospira sp.]|nr:ribbon-helix-helix domain-containing protein [Nitrospira sp.]